ncbi:hypothetical protein DL762_008014 [Monosporascus cannonballus]|uniref:Peptidase S8/S53 domain-containing protein n=1 Tax=Monosporascus cannonballus TaxID=155416 RepID=A0ABY0H182_9PEZI|nr:hypothetical protein DL762_008014 [Monosporascus cannonballus]
MYRAVDSTGATIEPYFEDKEHAIVLLSSNSACLASLLVTRCPELDSTRPGYKSPKTQMWGFTPSATNSYDVVRIKRGQADKMNPGIAEQGYNYTLTVKDKTDFSMDQLTASTTSYYSTLRLAMEMSMKPQLTAPGGTILNTWSTSDVKGYAVISGTLMAYLHDACVYALLKQSNHKLTLENIQRRLQATATPLAQ